MTLPLQPPLRLADKSPSPVYQSFLGLEQGIGQTISANLRRRRSSLGLSQNLTAKLMGISQATYRRFEDGKGQPRLYNAVLWSLNTGIPTSYLFQGSHYFLTEEPILGLEWQPLVSFLSLASEEAVDCFAKLARRLASAEYPVSEPPNSSEIPKLPSVLEYYRHLASHLQQWREGAGLTQYQAAELLEVSETTYRRYESPRQHTSISIVMMMRFHAATGVDPLKLSRNTPLHDYRIRQRSMLNVVATFVKELTPNEKDKLKEAVRYLSNVFLSQRAN